jgi:hypothetical protein
MRVPETDIIVKALEELKKGDSVRYDHTDWLVSAKELHEESKDYHETQWTLISGSKKTGYLVRSAEKKEDGFEFIWVFTKEIWLEHIQYQDLQGKWLDFQEKKFVSAPPQTVRFRETRFNYQGETSGKARDDDGNLVTKLTWDYYDDSRKRNLAIEIWKEPDRDYPEAYDGIVVQPSDFTVLPRPAVEVFRRKVNAGQGRNYAVCGWTAVVGFILFLNGVPFDYLAFAIIPVFAVIILYQTFSVLAWFSAACYGLAVAGAAVVLGADRLSFWSVSGLAMVMSVAVPRMMALAKPDFRGAPLEPLVFSASLLPSLWIYSFFMYFKYAPGPHDGGQLLATCVLPVVSTSAAYVLNRVLRNALPSSS